MLPSKLSAIGIEGSSEKEKGQGHQPPQERIYQVLGHPASRVVMVYISIIILINYSFWRRNHE